MVMLLVRAAPGLRVPREDNPRAHITEDRPVSVPASPYYLRRLKAGELISVSPPAPAAPSPEPLYP